MIHKITIRHSLNYLKVSNQSSRNMESNVERESEMNCVEVDL